MSIVSKGLLGLLAGLFVAALASQVAAQNQQRYAIMEKCIAQAQKEYPDAGQETSMRQRTMSYEACMAKAGQAP
jgi:hypothetical protein